MVATLLAEALNATRVSTELKQTLARSASTRYTRDVRIPVSIEWVGGAIGWKGKATLKDGTEITVHKAHNLVTVRRRIRRAIRAEVGTVEPEFVESLRLPRVIAEELEKFRALREQTDRITSEMLHRRTELAQKLLTELNVSEYDVAEWVGISSTYLAQLLQRGTTGTSEIEVTRPSEKKKRPRSA
jgi:hypothetical protein